jgi:hypothetical protein
MLNFIWLLATAPETDNVKSAGGTLLYLSAIGTVVSIAVALGTFIWQIRVRKRADALELSKQDTVVRSVTFDEMEAAIPGLGSLVDRWQTQAEDAFKEIEKMREREAVDRGRITDLELQVKVLKSELIEEKKKNMKLEDRLQILERKRSS